MHEPAQQPSGYKCSHRMASNPQTDDAEAADVRQNRTEKKFMLQMRRWKREVRRRDLGRRSEAAASNSQHRGVVEELPTAQACICHRGYAQALAQLPQLCLREARVHFDLSCPTVANFTLCGPPFLSFLDLFLVNPDLRSWKPGKVAVGGRRAKHTVEKTGSRP